MELREKKGLEIATTSQITREGNVWTVPSQTSSKKYSVNLFIQTCTCRDYESNGPKCKHLYAVEYLLQRESGLQLPLPEKRNKRTYKQDWPAYNRAQINEKDKCQLLLCELCKGIEEPVQEKGRPRSSLRDVLFAAVFKVYCHTPCRRFISDLREAHKKGYLSKEVSYSSLLEYFESELLTPYLRELVTQSSLPLRAIETDFAVDATGFSTSRFERWIRVKYSDPKMVDRRGWIKLHAMCGVKTNIVTSVEVTNGKAGDSPYFKPLVEATARNFVMNEVSADKAYSSEDNLQLVVDNAATPYIPFRSNTNPKDKRSSPLWKRMFHFYLYNQEWFMQHYHKRSNVESTFSMIKAKFGDSLRSRTETAQFNEALCKIVCHNLCVVIQSIYELGIDPAFWPEDDQPDDHSGPIAA
jgi:transposase